MLKYPNFLQLTPEGVSKYQNCPQLIPVRVPKYQNCPQLTPESVQQKTKTSKLNHKQKCHKFPQSITTTQALYAKRPIYKNSVHHFSMSKEKLKVILGVVK